MVFGLFKSRNKEQEADLQREFAEVNAFLGEMHMDLKAVVALQVSNVRLRNLARYPAEMLDGDVLAAAREVWYDPLRTWKKVIKSEMRYVEDLRLSCMKTMVENRHNEAVVGEASLVLAATRVICNTWQACLHPEFQPQAREMWRLLAEAFPRVEPWLAEADEKSRAQGIDRVDPFET